MQLSSYQHKIVSYYEATENAYKDAWDLQHSNAIHYGYSDAKAGSFRQSLTRMNEVMKEAAAITANDVVLDAGCGVGGSSIYLAETVGCQVKGITLSERQVMAANKIINERKLDAKVTIQQGDYSRTSFPDNSFDVVWGCESICYADDKARFIEEAFRILKPGGRLVVADGFVSDFNNNDHPFIRRWLDGWQVNYLESPQRFQQFMAGAGFSDIKFADVTRNTLPSSKRLYRFYFLASLYVFWRKITLRDTSTKMQRENISACRYQYLGMKKGLWKYGLIVGTK